MGLYALFCVIALAVCLGGYIVYRIGSGQVKRWRRGPIEYTIRVWGEWPARPRTDQLHPCRVEMEFHLELEGDTPAAQQAARGESTDRVMAEFRRLCQPLGEAKQVGAVRFAPADDDNAQRDTF